MAHLSDDDLPSDFDVIIQGTGFVQSVLAAALSRCGKSVLHLDRNPFYGEEWGTLMYRELRSWISANQEVCRGEAVAAANMGENGLPHVSRPVDIQQPGETVVEVGKSMHQRVRNVEEKVYKCQDDEALNGQQTDDSSQANGGEEATSSPLQATALTWESLGDKKKYFNFDLMPKLLLARGPLVDLLTSSTISKYLEFRATTAIMQCTAGGRLEQVPCSRTDLFATKAVSLPDKRKMMKFLQFCVEYEQHLDQYEDYKKRPFVEFLIAQGLTPPLISYVLYSIAFCSGEVTTEEGLEATRLFLHSLGRFGNTPFLYPVYGCGELPQAFCRFCAVFGGVYVLKRSIKSLILDDTR